MAAGMINDEAYLDERFDSIADARAEEWELAHPPDMTCGECGAEWWGDWTPFTRSDPAEPRNPDCPWCNA
jgi:hypothetical protein